MVPSMITYLRAAIEGLAEATALSLFIIALFVWAIILTERLPDASQDGETPVRLVNIHGR